MTVTADAKRRVTLHGANPGDCFQVEQTGDEYRLTLLKPASKADKVHLIKSRQGYLVAQGPHPITEEMVRSELDKFP